jgi:hypothetical protein
MENKNKGVNNTSVISVKLKKFKDIDVDTAIEPKIDTTFEQYLSKIKYEGKMMVLDTKALIINIM